MLQSGFWISSHYLNCRWVGALVVVAVVVLPAERLRVEDAQRPVLCRNDIADVD